MQSRGIFNYFIGAINQDHALDFIDVFILLFEIYSYLAVLHGMDFANDIPIARTYRATLS
jgi:hypothetical protein